ncbi:helix-turn-helix domain-containing protein [Ancylobacter oerskovii]|uniref:Helix-turn-helix domain-containing protein n=1 Tax=Ancylobacter oerskovii TaxID=459519 RepID=A0ABW4YW55_9HYPH|nr:helix-turn-helix domain-containing protein [Ancylobacter oerskovii]MBS7544079.1 helix-turn-helix domain-containing protein [Ancylobacter oerskovii]
METYERFDVSTTRLKGSDKFDCWREMARRSMVSVEIETPSPEAFDIAAKGVIQGEFTFGRIKCRPCTIMRNPDRAFDSSAESLLLFFVNSGTLMAEQSGRSCLLGAGDGVALATDRPYALRIEGAHEVAAIRLPRHLIGQPPGEVEIITARNLSDVKVYGSTLFSFANDICNAPDALDSFLLGRLGLSFSGIFASSVPFLSNSAPHRSGAPSRRATLDRVKSFVDAHMADPRLTPGYVAERMRFSSRYLAKLFEIEGTSLGRYIWDQRLDRAASDLVRGDGLARSVSTVAFSYGFKDPSHFSRAFRQRFHQSPSQYRDRIHRDPEPASKANEP